MKKDLEKKDELVKELTAIKSVFYPQLFPLFTSLFLHRDPSRHVHFEKERHDLFIGHDRTALDATRREVDQYRIKVDELTHDVIPSFSTRFSSDRFSLI